MVYSTNMSGEKAEIVKPDGGTTPITIDTVNLREEGSEGAVFDVDVNFQKADEQKTIPLLHKVLDSPESADILHQRYTAAKDAGLPVPTTFRIVQDESGKKGLLLTDLTEGKKNLLIEGGGAQLDDKWQQVFNDVDLEEYVREDSPKSIITMAQKAASYGIELSSDSYGFILKADGNHEIVFFDFGRVFIGKESADIDGYTFTEQGAYEWSGTRTHTLSREQLFEENRRMLQREIDEIKKLQNKVNAD